MLVESHGTVVFVLVEGHGRALVLLVESHTTTIWKLNASRLFVCYAKEFQKVWFG